VTRKIFWRVAIGDIILLLLFAYGGEVSHELFFPDSLILSVLHAALPFALVWFPAAYVMDALADPRGSRLLNWLARAAGAWFIAAPLGIVVRGWIINRAVIPMTFLEVTYLLGLAFFVGWRVMLILFFRWRSISKFQISRSNFQNKEVR
jgi:hypothetical protein